MYSPEDYQHLQTKLERNTHDFSNEAEGYELCRLLLVHTENIRSLVNKVSQRHKRGWEHEWLFQDMITRQCVNVSESIFTLLRNDQYTMAIHGTRYLFEGLLILRGLNRDIERAKRIAREFTIEIDTLLNIGERDYSHSFKYIDEIGRIRQSEKDRLINDHGKVKEFYNLLSQRASHPLRIDLINVDKENAPGPRQDASESSLWLLLGIVEEYLIALAEASVSIDSGNLPEQIKEDIRSIINDPHPVFVEDYVE